MKISKINIKNCLGIKEIEFNPTDVTLIEGKSKSGKTSIIDSIVQFLSNNGERPDFVRTGEKKGEVYIEFDNGLIGKKTFKSDGKPSSVSLEKDGMQPKGAETFLKSLFNPNQVNPISFISKSVKEQTETILSAVPMELPEEKIVLLFDENLAKNVMGEHALKICKYLESAYFDLRKESNSQIKYFESDIELLKNKIPYQYDAEKWCNFSIAEISKKISDAAKQNEYIANCNKIISDVDNQKAILKNKRDSDIELINEKIKQLQRSIDEVTKKCDDDVELAEEKAAKSKEWLYGKEIIDTDPLLEEAKEAEKMKSFIGLADDLVKKQKWFEDEKLKNADYENKLKIARSLPAELIKSANLPIKGMSINDSGEIVVNERPIKNLSGADRLDFAIEIAKLTCGELKTILVNGFEAMGYLFVEGVNILPVVAIWFRFVDRSRQMNIYQKIAEVMKEIQYLSKDGHVKFNSTDYKALSEEKVTSIIRPCLIKHGIVIVPIEQEPKKQGNISSVNTKYRIQNIDDVDDYIVAASSGEGADTQDKGVGKAMTYAYKYMLLRTFCNTHRRRPRQNFFC